MLWFTSRFLPNGCRYIEMFRRVTLSAHFRTSLLTFNEDNAGNDGMVRLIDEHGKNIGLMTKDEAEKIAQENKMHLLPILGKKAASNEIFKLMNEKKSKELLEQKNKVEPVRKRKTMTMSTKIGDGDLTRKAQNILKFIEKDYEVYLRIEKIHGKTDIFPRAVYDNLMSKFDGDVKSTKRRDAEHIFDAYLTKKEK